MKNLYSKKTFLTALLAVAFSFTGYSQDGLTLAGFEFATGNIPNSTDAQATGPGDYVLTFTSAGSQDYDISYISTFYDGAGEGKVLVLAPLALTGPFGVSESSMELTIPGGVENLQVFGYAGPDPSGIVFVQPKLVANGEVYTVVVDQTNPTPIAINKTGDVKLTFTISTTGDMDAVNILGLAWTNYTLGNENLAIKSAKLFPNPTNGSSIISINSSINKVELFNITGAKVRSFNNISNGKLDISDIDNGIYLFSGTDNDGVKYSGKIIKN